MTARKPKAEHKPNGRPSPYSEKFDNMAYVACYRGGFSDKRLGLLFSVSEVTINAWKNKYPNFLMCIKKGKDDHDSLEIEKSLNKIARGFSYNETVKKPMIVRDQEGDAVLDNNGEVKTSLKVTKVTRKQVTPNERAIEFWLRNRQRERWPDKKDVALSGDVTINVLDNFK